MSVVGHEARPPSPEPAVPERSGAASEVDRNETGFPLPAEVRGRMEAAVGGDLSDVRLHTDATAASRASGHGALAVTEGHDVSIADSWYRPGTLAGEALLAHELAHVRQQEGSPAAGPAVSGGAERRSEAEADRAAFVAALRLFDPAGSALARPPTITVGMGIHLQGCAPPPSTEPIRELPSREEYERRGELLPRAIEDIVSGAPGLDLGMPAGELVLDRRELAPTEEADLGRAPLPPDYGSDAPELSTEQRRTRLAAMEVRQARIDALLADLDGSGPAGRGLFGGLAAASIWGARLQLEPGSPAPIRLWLTTDEAAMLPIEPAQQSRDIVRGEAVQERVLEALTELRERRAQESGSASRLSDYDVTPALEAVDEVRRAYRDAVDAILGDEALSKLATAEELHGALEPKLMSLQLAYFEGRSSAYQELRPAISAIRDWAFDLQARLTKLEKAVPELKEARRRKDPTLEAKERAFVRDAGLVAVGIEALGEWDLGVQAYEYLRGNSALWGFEGVDDIAWRLGQMKRAYEDEDLAYLQLLLRDHRADPAVAKYFASLPEIVEWSQFAIMMAITLVAVVAAAGVGVLVGAAATSVLIGAGAAKGSLLVLGVTFVTKAGAEALVFTVISRALAEQFPGMAPTSPFWSEFLWNFGLFLSMGLATKGVGALVKGASRLVATAAVGGTSYAVLQGYGYLRFYVEHGETMNAAQFAKMSAQNAVMLVGLWAGARPFQPMLEKLEGLVAVSRFRSLYGERFARIEADRAELVRDSRQRLEERPDATPDDAADLSARAEDINTRLDAFVSDVISDPRVDVVALQREAGLLATEVQSVSVPELLREGGLDPSVLLRPSGEESTWSYEPGKTGVLVKALEDAGHEVASPVRLIGGTAVVEAAGHRQGPGRVRRTPAGCAAGRGGGEAGGVRGRPGKRRRSAAQQQSQLRQIRNLRQRIYRWRRQSVGDQPTLNATRAFTEQLNEMARRAREGEDVSPEIAELTDSLSSLRPRTGPSRLADVERVETRLRRRAGRARNADTRAELEALAEDAADLVGKLKRDPTYDARLSLRRIRQQERRAGAREYEVYIPLEDPVVVGEIGQWLARETRPLPDYPGGEFLRNEMLDQFYTADVMALRQSPRSAGRDVATTEQMRAIVEEGIASGRFPPEYVEAYEANRGPDGWPRTKDGRAWEIDHVRELWQEGGDRLSNYLPLDPRLHNIKTDIMRRFRLQYREPAMREGEQTDIRDQE